MPSWFNLSQASHRGLVEPQKVDRVADRRLIAIPCLGIKCAQITPHVPCSKHGIWGMVIHPTMGILTIRHVMSNSACESVTTATFTLQGWQRVDDCPRSTIPPKDGLSRNILRYEMDRNGLSMSIYHQFSLIFMAIYWDIAAWRNHEKPTLMVKNPHREEPSLG